MLQICNIPPLETLLRSSLEALRDVFPVHDVPERLHVVGAHVLVVEVVGVLPHVELQQRGHSESALPCWSKS